MFKLTIKTPERRYWRRLATFIVNSEHISHLFLVFLLLTLDKKMFAGKWNKVKKNEKHKCILFLHYFWFCT